MTILERAISIRIARGEALKDILASYKRLTEEQKNALREKFGGTK